MRPALALLRRRGAVGLVDEHQFMGTALFDQAWRLALPVGATRDHPAANPFGPDSVPLDDVAFPLLLVVDPDVLHDRIQDYAARLTAMWKPNLRCCHVQRGPGPWVLHL